MLRLEALRGPRAGVLRIAIAGFAAIALVVIGMASFSFFYSKRSQPLQTQAQGVATPAGGIVAGATFPEFRLTDVDGRTLTNETLTARPAIIWFTAAWCVPCQIGAKKVAKLDDELGGGAFDVLVVFVDPNEKEQDLVRWREKFANQDWMVSFDSINSPGESIAQKVKLRFLDSKYILDKKGVIQDINFHIAGEEYLNTIRSVLRGAS